LPVPRLLLLPGCPGGAFACGALRPLVAADPCLLPALDDGELEGLVAHELAHLRRRDPLLCLLVGAFRDLTFFLPTVHVAARWLRHEQEESADEVAARSTARPVALASSILKVWSQTSAKGPRVACAAVPGGLRLATAGPRVTPPTLTDGARLVTRRVERLLAGVQPPSTRRSAAEITLAAIVLVVALLAALSVPHWIMQKTKTAELWVLSSGAAALAGGEHDESPAFATFRSITDAPVAAPATSGAPSAVADGVEDAGCPCIESQAQLREGVGARAPEPDARLRWSDGSDDYTLRDIPRTHKLLEVDRLGSRVGVFLVEGGR
jgi:beta-lactamase regulating signal transducer with metallopeptidase domain